MKLEDKIQALKRSSKYREDYKKYDAFRGKNKIFDTCLDECLTPIYHVSPEGQKLCEKFKIPFPFNPDAAIDMPILPITPKPLRREKSKSIFGLKEGKYLEVIEKYGRREGD